MYKKRVENEVENNKFQPLGLEFNTYLTPTKFTERQPGPAITSKSL